MHMGAYVGQPHPRPATRRLLAGRGRYTDDIRLPRMLHAAFLRSPYPHARIRSIDPTAAKAVDGVAAVLMAADLEPVCAGWRGESGRFPALRSPEQTALARERACWQGEPVVMVVAESRAIAEDAVELVSVEWEELPAIADLEGSIAADAPKIHPDLPDNVGFEMVIGEPDEPAAFRNAAVVVEEVIRFGRQTGVTLEPRSIIASWDPADGTLTVYQSTQVPHQMQMLFASLLGVPAHKVRVVAPDVGGAFGIKLHMYPDEVAVCAASRLLGRPVKFVADRLEAFSSDVHAREHLIKARLALTADGRMLAFDVDDLHGMGAYSIAPRGSVAEAVGATRMVGSPYRFDAFRGRIRSVFQNKPPAGQYRAVGHPIACAITERLVERAAAKLGMDSIELRRRNFASPGDTPWVSPAGIKLFGMSHEACLEKLLALMPFDEVVRDRDAGRKAGRLRGIGIAAYVELTASGPEVYGRSGTPVTSVDSVTVRLEPSGDVTCLASVTEQGQGTSVAVQQIVATELGLPMEAVTVMTGDTAVVPPGGGAWASRGVAIGGEAALQAAGRLRDSILRLAARLLQVSPDALALRDGAIVERMSGAARMTLRELGELSYFRTHDLPPDSDLALAVTHQYRRVENAFLPTNGIQASYVDVDPDTGIVTLLGHWVVEDCGRVVNPLLLDEQIRGGVIQGIGHALFEHCRYDDSGQCLAATMADYVVPMSAEMPDIVIGHVETPYPGSELGAKGAGEAGTCAAAGAVLNAVNDALAPAGAAVSELPMTPTVILTALGSLGSRSGVS